MQVIAAFGKDELSTVFVGRTEGEKKGLVEFVESVQPPIPREKKWVLIVSTLLGCPMGCAFCDAGGSYGGRLSSDDIEAQIDFLVRRRFPDGRVPMPKFKIQFARMGEPALNPALPGLLRRLPGLYEAPGLLPSVSSVAPAGTEPFFEELLRVKNGYYGAGRFQLQFSIHTTDPDVRRRLIPARTIDLSWVAEFETRFRNPGDQKVTLNFAAAESVPVDPAAIRRLFGPDDFIIKLTPVNPTEKAAESGLKSAIDPARPESGLALKRAFEKEGFQVILSIGEVEENDIGSNCGQFVSRIRKGGDLAGERYSARLYA